MAIRVICTCGKSLAVKDEYAGKRLKCPGCGQTLKVPVGAAAKPQPASGPETAKPAASKPAAPPIAKERKAASKACPSCDATMPTNAVLCVNCGYDWRTGSKLKSDERTGDKRRTAWIIAASAGGGGLLVGAVVVYFALREPASTDVAGRPPTTDPVIPPRLTAPVPTGAQPPIGGSTKPANPEPRAGLVLPALPPRVSFGVARQAGDGSQATLAYDHQVKPLADTLSRAATAALSEVKTFGNSLALAAFLRAVNAAKPPSGSFTVTLLNEHRQLAGAIEQTVAADGRAELVAFLGFENSDGSRVMVSVSDASREVREEIVQWAWKMMESLRAGHASADSPGAIAAFAEAIRSANPSWPVVARFIDKHGRTVATIRHTPGSRLVVHWIAHNSDGGVIAYSVTDADGKISDRIIGAGRPVLTAVRSKHPELQPGAAATFRDSLKAVGVTDPVSAAFYDPKGRLIEAIHTGTGETLASAAGPGTGEKPPPKPADNTVVGKWKDAADTIEVEFRLGKWEKDDKEQPDGDGMAFLIVWAGKADAKGERPVAQAGFVVWKKTAESISFDGAVAKGTGILQKDGKELRLSIGENHLLLARSSAGSPPTIPLPAPGDKPPPKPPDPPKAGKKTKPYDFAAWMEAREAELKALGYKIGEQRGSVQVSDDLTVDKVPVEFIKAHFGNGAIIIDVLGYPSTVKSDIPKVVSGLAEDWLEPLWIDAKPDALKARPRIELIRTDAKLHSELAKLFGAKGDPLDKLLAGVPKKNLSVRELFISDSKMAGLRSPISVPHLLKRFDPNAAAAEEDADSVAEEIIWSKEAGIGDGTYKSLPESRRVIQAAILENLGFEIGHPGHKDPAKRKQAVEKLDAAKRACLEAWREAAEKSK